MESDEAEGRGRLSFTSNDYVHLVSGQSLMTVTVRVRVRVSVKGDKIIFMGFSLGVLRWDNFPFFSEGFLRGFSRGGLRWARGGFSTQLYVPICTTTFPCV